MRLRERVQGFTIGAAVMGALMIGLPALTAPVSPSADMDELAAQFGVEIIWSDTNPCRAKDPNLDGCYLHAMPSRIFVSPDYAPDSMRHLVLHEIGHAIQARLGIPQDECAADKFAQSLGSGWHIYDCKH